MAELFGIALPLLMFVAGVGLAAAEAVVPGAHFIVLGIALMVAGLVGLLVGPLVPLLATPLVLAFLTLVVGAGAFWGYRNLDLYQGQGRGQTRNSSDLRGQSGVVTERVSRGEGEVKLENGGFNPYYRARSMEGDIPVGAEVIVLDPGGGNVITVAPLSDDIDDIDRELARERARVAEADAETEDAT